MVRTDYDEGMPQLWLIPTCGQMADMPGGEATLELLLLRRLLCAQVYRA